MLGPKCGDEETPSDLDQAFAAHGRRDANPVVNEAAELFGDLETAISHAVRTTPRGIQPWICCDKKFVLSPEDILRAHTQFREVN
jgi:hypothetical protein